MRTNNEHINLVKALVMRWRALGLMAVAFARTVSLHAKCDPARALRDAEMLEVWLRFALFGIIGDLARLNADGGDHWSHDDDLQYLRQIAVSLAALAILMAKIRRESFWQIGFADSVRRVSRRRNALVGTTPFEGGGYRCGGPAPQADAFPNLAFLDSS